MVRDLVIDVDDPRRGDIRGLLETGTTAGFAAARALYHGAGFEPCQPFGGYPPSSENYFMTVTLR